MFEFSEFDGQLILKIFDLLFIIVAAILAYFFGIKKLVKERELTRKENELSRKINLYRQLVRDLTVIPDIGNYNEQQIEVLRKKLNIYVIELLQYAPDNIYREYVKIISGIKRGASAKPIYEFLITIRKELIPDTTIKADDIVEIAEIKK